MEKIKQFLTSNKGKDILTVIIEVLVGLGSFELGRLSKSDTASGIKIEYQAQEANAQSAFESAQTTKKASPINSTRADGKNFFASSRGSNYYPITCGAGKTIMIENRVYFATKGEAKTAGYELSSACK